MKIDKVIERIKASEKLSDEQKARLVRICERIRTIIDAIRKALAEEGMSGEVASWPEY